MNHIIIEFENQKRKLEILERLQMIFGNLKYAGKLRVAIDGLSHLIDELRRMEWAEQYPTG